MNYSLIDWDAGTRVAIIQVPGCVKQTAIDVPSEVVKDSQSWLDFLESAAQDVLRNMDPMSATYDSSLLGS